MTIRKQNEALGTNDENNEFEKLMINATGRAQWQSRANDLK
jgi:hypothetical protein